MSDVDLSEYDHWLRRQRYQPSTIDSTLRHLHMLHVISGLTPLSAPHVRRYLRFVKATRKNPMGARFLEHAKHIGLQPAADTKRGGGRVREPLSTAHWQALRAALRREANAGSDTAQLLLVYMHADRRIGHFLKRSSRLAVQPEFCEDKLSRDWIAAQNATRKTIVPLYKLLCDTERCTYARMRRKLQIVAERLGYDVDLDTLYRSRQKIRAMQEVA